MVGVDVGCDLENEATEFGFLGIDHAFFGSDGAGSRCDLDETIEQFFDTKVVECGTKEHGRDFGRKIGVNVESGVDTVDEFEVFAEFGRIAIADVGFEFALCVDVYGHFFGHFLFVGREEIELLLEDVVDAFETLALVDGP